MKHPKRTPTTLWDFFENEVRPALAAGLDSAFPEFGFRRGRGEWWTATDAPSGFGDYGVRDRKLTANAWGLRSFKASAVAVPWTAYILGRTETPRGADFVDAVKKLAERLGLDASVLDRERTPEQVEEDHKRVRRGDLLEDFVADAHAVLVDERAGKTARDYLTRRGFKAEDLEGLAFGVYTTPKTVEERLKALGYTAEEVGASGLLADGRWTGRVVFPWRDERGRILTVAARDTTGTVEDSQKYLNLRDHEKGTPFGLDVAVRSKTAHREGLVLVEGLLDVVLLQTLGMDNVAALGQSGEYLTAERWERLARLRFPSFTLCMDNDKPKEDGTRPGLVGLGKALDNLSNVDNVPNVHVIDPSELGAAKDPDELVRTKGLDAFREVLKARRPWVSWRGEALLGDVNTASPEGERFDAAGRVLDFVKYVRGPRVTLAEEELLRLTSERTCFNVDKLKDISATEAERRRREDNEKAVDSALRTAQADLSKGASVEDVVGDLEESLALARARTEAAPPPLSVDRILEETRREPEGLVSGWAALDALGVRFTPGELALVAGRVGHGKTSVVVNLLRNWIRSEAVDGPVVFYSLEEPERRVVHRLIALETLEYGSGWTAREVRAYLKDPKGENPHNPSGDYPDEDALHAAIDRVREWEDRLQVVWRPSWDVKALEAHARERAALGPVGAVLVDYIQRIPPTPGFKADRRDQEVSYIGRTLKTLAVDLEVPVVLGAQINRTPAESLDLDEIHKAEDFYAAIQTIRKARPELHHLREGGSEQEADLVLGFLNYAADYRVDAERKNSTPPATLLEVGTLKNREGEVGAWASLAFEGRYRLIRNAEDQEADSWKVERTPSSAKRDESLTRRAELKVEAEREKTARAEKARQTAELKASTEKARTERTRLQANASTMLSVEPKAPSGRKNPW